MLHWLLKGLYIMDDIKVKNASVGVGHKKPSDYPSAETPHTHPTSTLSDQSKRVSIPKLSRSRVPKKMILVLSAILLISCIGTSYYYFNKKSTATAMLPLPANIINGVDFPLYVPSMLPTGYGYKAGSANIRNGILFYKLSSGAKTITITEQSLPSIAIDLTKVPSYSSLKVPAGRGAIGVSVGNPSVIIMTDTTMININSTKDTPKDIVSNLAQSITLLPHMPSQ